MKYLRSCFLSVLLKRTNQLQAILRTKDRTHDTPIIINLLGFIYLVFVPLGPPLRTKIDKSIEELTEISHFLISHLCTSAHLNRINHHRRSRSQEVSRLSNFLFTYSLPNISLIFHLFWTRDGLLYSWFWPLRGAKVVLGVAGCNASSMGWRFANVYFLTPIPCRWPHAAKNLHHHRDA